MISPNIFRDSITYAITDRSHYGSSEIDREVGLLRLTEYLAQNGIAFIQLREKDVVTQDQLRLARRMLQTLRNTGSKTRLLINAGPDSRADIAAAAGANGLHLTSEKASLSVSQARQVLRGAGQAEPIISVSCHTLADVQRARDDAADIILFGPVFGKFINGKLAVPGTGLDLLTAACAPAGRIPILALGGITLENAASCIDAGASGIAAIRLFQELTP